MERKDFLKAAGALGISTILPFSKTKAAINKLAQTGLAANTCILIPQETAGPFPWNMMTNSLFFRQDITEGNPGAPLHLTLTVVDINNNCAPVTNARVDIWHTDKDGNYSEYGSFSGQTFFRGYQITDANGQVSFVTVYPGWYAGRVTHIHFQVFLNSVLSATSQMAFPDATNTTVYNTSLYSAHGQNPTVNSSDGVFSDMSNTAYEMLTIAANGSGGYDASLTIGIDVPVAGVINLEPETGGQFKLRQNFPNPFSGITTIPFKLANPSLVKIAIYDMNGKKVLDLVDQEMNAGDQKVILDRDNGKTAIPKGNYVYQLTVENQHGVFHQCKVLTAN
jgi:protocatechuate 3,4-dioxygenase beta subunit